MARAPVLLVFALLIAGCGDQEREIARSAERAWTAHRVAERGATISLPPGWGLAGESLTPSLADPFEVFSAGNFPLRHHPGECPHLPSALQDLGEAGVIVSVLEAGDGTRPGGYPARPERFEPHQATSEVACSPARGELHWFTFADGGRNFYGIVAYGPATAAEARADGFEVLTRATYRADAGPN